MPRKLQETIAEGKQVDTQAVAAEIREEVSASKKFPSRSQGFMVYAPFDLLGAHYEVGDTFNPSADWKRDTAFDEFRGIEKRRGTTNGIAFNVPGEIIDKNTGERASSRMILPLEEA